MIVKTKLFTKFKNRLPDFKDPKIKLKTALYSGSAAMLAMFFLAVTLPLTSHPVFCGQFCHSMRREYQTWQRSSHSKITCTACHVEPGLPALFYEKGVDGIIGTGYELLNTYDKPINSSSHLGFEKMSNNICERCHDMLNSPVRTSEFFNAKMRGKGKNKFHNKHLKKGLPCTLCHNRVVHKDVNKPNILKAAGYALNSSVAKINYKDGMSMTEGCFRCHSPINRVDKELVKKYKAQDAPRQCVNCHKPGLMPELPKGHTQKNWRKKHVPVAKRDLSYCFKCHGRKSRINNEGKIWCTKCHSDAIVRIWLDKYLAK